MAGQIAIQWSLNQATSDLIEVSKGMIAAATSDNVQVLALLAGESFGATLAMSRETCDKAYSLCSQDQTSAVVNFLKLQIGYKRGDCGWQLCKSDAGLRFLGLVACLCTLDHWKAAQALHAMITETAVDKTLIPSPQQLKQLIRALEYRLAKSAFAESVLGWSLYLSDFKSTRSTNPPINEPDIRTLVGLVKAVRSLERVGETRKLLITTSATLAPWICAFLKWCIGDPPSIVSPNETPLLTNPSSRAFLKLVETPQEQIKISILDEIGNIAHLVTSDASIQTIKGMVGINAYFNKLINDLFGSKNTPTYRACEEAIPYACNLVYSKLRYSTEATSSSLNMDLWKNLPLQLEGSTAKWGQPFPEKRKIATVLNTVLGLEELPTLPELEPGELIADLSVARVLRESIRRSCRCTLCKNNGGRQCEFTRFIEDTSICVAHILVVSLLESGDPEGAQLYFRSRYGTLSDRKHEFVVAITSILTDGKPYVFDALHIFHAALELLGHSDNDESKVKNTWMMSSHYGQTVYPRILETRVLDEEGITRLVCIPGQLVWNDSSYSNVRSNVVDKYLAMETPDQSDGEDDICVIRRVTEDLAPSNAFADRRISWQVGVGEDYLKVSILSKDFPSLPIRDPMNAISAAVRSIFVDCPHDPKATLPLLRMPVYCTTPVKPDPPPRRGGAVGVVQCDRNDPMRFFTLTAGKPGVIRGYSCLECCLLYCNMASLDFVVC